MKFNIASLSVMVIVFFGIQSCKKDSTAGGGTTPPSTTAPVLTNVYFIDTTLAHPKDTLAKYNITYDSQGRPLNLTYGVINTLGDSTYSTKENYYYNGNDTFAYKVTLDEKRYTGITSTSYQEVNFYKFVNQQLVSDSGITSIITSTNTYTYYPAYIKKVTLFYMSNPVTSQYVGYDNVYQTKVSGNITHQLDTAIIYAPYGTDYQRFETTASYAPNPNPLYKVILPRSTGILSIAVGDFDRSGIQKNLVLQQTADFNEWSIPSSATFTPYNSQANYTYTFRTDGYPSEARYVYTYNSFNYGYVQRLKILFAYK